MDYAIRIFLLINTIFIFLIGQESNEVYYSNSNISSLSKEDLDFLKNIANKNLSKKVRICMHKNIDDSIHEMFIIHMKDCYVRPHKHLNKVESLSIIEGEVDYVLFNEDGSIKKITNMGDPFSGKQFYKKLYNSEFHMLIIRTKYLVFHEIINGPFSKKNTIFPDWAPEKSDKEFLSKVNNSILKFNNK